ncbi:PREDICTED: pulmonary surfactant-associated protein A-like [Nanorana parkeri]|uniref:pulmonary surfactant-associated protein A-like n=1 Tax=Nanorana parkeri TaxID=125878 RepID=UPI000854F1CC|nr:PREDICTED: pulmonary surfactant-associated protein A-like [Nanorana parkeri]
MNEKKNKTRPKPSGPFYFLLANLVQYNEVNMEEGEAAQFSSSAHKEDDDRKRKQRDELIRIPASLDPEVLSQLENINNRITKLEGVLLLQGKIQQVNNKILATNGKEVDFEASKTTCKDVHGSIATPMYEEENNALLTILKEFNRYAYLGILEGPATGEFHYLDEYHYNDGNHLNYTHWRKNEPSGKGKENCVEMYTDGTWNDKACNQKRLTVCEF